MPARHAYALRRYAADKYCATLMLRCRHLRGTIRHMLRYATTPRFHFAYDYFISIITIAAAADGLSAPPAHYITPRDDERRKERWRAMRYARSAPYVYAVDERIN